MSRDTWRDIILQSCMESGTCVIYDRAAAWCEYFPDEIRFCDYNNCPRRMRAEMGIGRAFTAMMERASYRETLARMDAGKKYVMDILRRDVK